MTELEKLCHDSIRVIREAGDFIRAETGKVREEAIEEKSLNSLVSYVDRQAEERLVEGLGRLLPGATFLTEEETVARAEGEHQWIIDPLDGTTNFLHQLPVFSVSVALRRGGRTVLGVVYEVNQRECFSAWLGGGARLNDRPIRVSTRRPLSETLLATGFPYHDFTWIEPYFRILDRFIREARGIRRFGSAAVDLAYVACGRFDGFFEYSLNAWDVAAGAFLVAEAGGRVSDFRAGDNYLFGREIVAANPFVFNEIQQTVQKAFYP